MEMNDTLENWKLTLNRFGMCSCCATFYPFIQQLSNSRVVTCTNAPLLVAQWGEILSEGLFFIFMQLCFHKIVMTEKQMYSVDRQWCLESIHTLRFESIHTLLRRRVWIDSRRHWRSTLYISWPFFKQQKKINLQLTRRAGFEVTGLSEFFRTLIATMFGWNGDISAPDSFSTCSITISPLTQLTVNWK